MYVKGSRCSNYYFLNSLSFSVLPIIPSTGQVDIQNLNCQPIGAWGLA